MFFQQINYILKIKFIEKYLDNICYTILGKLLSINLKTMPIDQDRTEMENVSDFIKKLSQIIQQYPEVIDYSQSGKQVVIHDKQRFTKFILHKYFRHTQWKSFIRQMNMYNFKKLNRGPNILIFSNPQFYKGNQKNFDLIKRKIHTKIVYKQQVQNFERRSHKILEINHSETLLPQFIHKVARQRDQLSKKCAYIRRNLDVICRQRKNNEVKQISGPLKDCIQMIQQSACKFTDSIMRHSQMQIDEEQLMLQGCSEYMSQKKQGSIIKKQNKKINKGKEFERIFSENNHNQDEKMESNFLNNQNHSQDNQEEILQAQQQYNYTKYINL